MYELILRSGDSLTAAETNQLKCIWMECFGDSREYLDMFMPGLLPGVEVMTCTDGDRIVGVVYVFSFAMSTGRPAYYFYAGGVPKEYRRQGIFSSLFDYVISRDPDALYYLMAHGSLVDWYKNNWFGSVYSCRELALNKQKVPGSDDLTITRRTATAKEMYSLRRTHESSLKYDYISYPEWFFNMMKAEKAYCGDVFDIIVIDDKEYYIIGRYTDEYMIIDETSVPTCILEEKSQELLQLFDCSQIKIKLPLSDEESDKESHIIYSGQGSTCVSLWAPFTLE